ncbi:MATE family efflux transporter [Brevibacillus agri]|nr:MATE family efflux transporter [Brevibacillus invocatus]MED1645872.1 MATE family efflux transporter [Brevibacillus agri]MCM3431721.1 MATE family efflux transporter [Brevibacillus invocatus]MED1657569.1 MATE family efflux transporter [Brevibacillus agri]MED1690061.1 MATE family efflux transporter [Brevibacillus agri]MED1694022.1 MATE family efflux transporter [Brevibacillus agri]
MKVILALAVPAMIENMLQTVVGFVDTLFVSKLGLSEVTAVGVTNAILAVYLAVFLAMGVGTSALIAKSVGAGNLVKAKSIARQSTLLSALLGILFGLLTFLFAEPLLRLMGAEGSILADGVTYFRIVAVPSIFISLMMIFGSILRAAGDTKTPMKVGIWINLIHIVLDYVLIFGFLGITGYGIAGAAWATVIARAVGTIALYHKIQKSNLSFSWRNDGSREFFLPLLQISFPAAIERLIMRFGQVLYFGLIVRIGTDVYAAHTIAGNIEVFSYMPGYGLAVAATTLVGQNLGANRREDAYRYGILTSGMAVIFMSFIGILLFFFSPIAASWFTDQAEVIQMVTIALRIDAFAQPFLALGLVMAGALQGAGDTKSPMYSTAIGMWLIRVVGVYVLSIHFQLGIAGVWLSIAVDLFARAVFLYLRFIQKMRSNDHVHESNNNVSV